MTALEGIVAAVLALFAIAGLRWQDGRAAKRAEEIANEARIARESALAEHAKSRAEVDVRAASVESAETGAEAFNAAFDD